ncbi:MAG: hypothetical protein A3A43_01285 [Candidatus Liptonbacteria bacterium RIFCSPLOWO2_01_FULL_56_20]|uniref:Uncharacterized protein n=1 Tax=Candidatus Liptonbacteria bacterium RIFCSPLOWO2_01_FULL_56_20 TaxID=1798652 RepID=A0A1G2CJI3_9BACT|nr:MAG: putative membrane protein [Parcubacteria group bacterium GW2011_GWB1_56_8]OGZ01407.1 MAG: hypothetical protein A3A43_01285 [Candidatus Liptonbacteria bacterium RIFCSPLOWO2_01_FULL_56_20]
MEEEQKPFGTVDKVFLFMIAGLSDVADLISVFAFPVPVIGQVIYLANAFFISPLVWAVIQFWFFARVGFGGPGLISVAGGLGNMIGIPGSETLSVAIAVSLANHPKASALAGLTMGAGVGVAAARTAGAAAVEAGGTAARAGAAAAETGGAAARGAGAAETGTKLGAAEEAREGVGAAGKISEESFGIKKEPWERVEELMKNLPEPEQPKEGDEGVDLDDETGAVDLRKAA